MSSLDTVVIVGASLAGLRSAQALRRLGFEGRLVAIGDEAHMPYDRPPLSKEVLAGKWDADRTALYKPENDDALEVDWRLGLAATALDPGAKRVTLADGSEVAYDGLVIATGASVRTLPNTPALEGIHTLRTLDDCLAIRATLDASPRVTVIGAGFIGAEVAATCRARGLEVAMIEAAPVPLERGLGREMGDYMGEIHREQGVDLRCGVGVSGFRGEGRVEAVELADGSVLETDLVVVGIGVAPNTGWLEGSGLALDDGVVCDAACRAAPGIVAAGDVARWPNRRFAETMRIEHWTNGTEQADAAAASLLAGEAAVPPFEPVPFFWSDQYDRKIQFGGRGGADCETRIVDGSLEQRRFVMLYGQAGRLRGVLGLNRARLVMKYRNFIREGMGFEEACQAGRES